MGRYRKRFKFEIDDDYSKNYKNLYKIIGKGPEDHGVDMIIKRTSEDWYQLTINNPRREHISVNVVIRYNLYLYIGIPRLFHPVIQ